MICRRLITRFFSYRNAKIQGKFQRNENIISDYTSLSSDLQQTSAEPCEFATFSIHSDIKRAIKSAFSFEKSTPVQTAVISQMPLKSDMIVQARTGTGKTLAFAIMAIDRYLREKDCRILILAPTRELAKQSSTEISKLSKHLGIQVCSLIGGESKMRQIANLNRNPAILVGTPGRVLDILNVKSSIVPLLQTWVLDEADRMLEIGFRDDIFKIKTIIAKNSKLKTLLFSATFPKNVNELIKNTLTDPITISTVPKSETLCSDKVEQYYLVAKTELELLAVLKSQTMKYRKIMVFVPTAKAADLMADVFAQSGVNNVLALHARQTQQTRTKISNAFRSADSAIIFTTDVSARGIDYPNVDLVVQLGMPSSSEQYVHRIGRTGRKDSGTSIMLLAEYEKSFVKVLEKAGISLKQLLDTDNLQDALNSIQNIKADRIMIKQLEEYMKSILGYYLTQFDLMKQFNRGLSPREIVESQARFVKSLGLERMPQMPATFPQEFLPKSENVYLRKRFI